MKQTENWKQLEALLKLMPDQGNLIRGLVIGLLNEREAEIKRELRGKIEQLSEDEFSDEYPIEYKSGWQDVIRQILSLLQPEADQSLAEAGKKNTFEEYIEEKLQGNPELREKVRKAEEGIDKRKS